MIDRVGDVAELALFTRKQADLVGGEHHDAALRHIQGVAVMLFLVAAEAIIQDYRPASDSGGFALATGMNRS